jgi:hypothetical protein
VTDPTAGLRCCWHECYAQWSALRALVFEANHRGLSRLPSRRQPFRSESQDQCEKSVEKSIKFSLRLRVEFTAASSRLTGAGRGADTLSSWRERPTPLAAGLAGQAALRVVAHATGLAFATARAVRHQAGGTERRPTTTACNLRDDLQLPSELAARESPIRRGRFLQRYAVQGEHLARGPCSPTVFPPVMY